MYSQNLTTRNSTTAVKAVCAVVFFVFSFVWLYWFQTDYLAIAQHVLSHGQTHYNRFASFAVITVIAFFIRFFVQKFTRLEANYHALSYFPSVLLLAVLGSFDIGMDEDYSVVRLIMIAFSALLIWEMAVYVCKNTYHTDSFNKHADIDFRKIWVNVTILLCMFVVPISMTDTDAVHRYRAHIERAIMDEDYEEALRTGYHSRETDASLTMLRAYALSKQRLLGDRLFEYPVSCTGTDLLPLLDSRSKSITVKKKDFYHLLGAIPVGFTSQSKYLLALHKDSLETAEAADYRLCACLVDGRIEDFAELLPVYYDLAQSLPRHYREAIILYRVLHPGTFAAYADDVTERDWNSFHSLLKTYVHQTERKLKVSETFEGTYWYYYFFQLDKSMPVID